VLNAAVAKVRQFVVIASDPRQSDELRNEVEGALNEVIGALNERTGYLNETMGKMMPLVSIANATLETPRRYLCEEFAELADIQDSERHQFYEYAAKALTRWFDAAIFHKSGSAACILGALKRSMTDSCEQLAAVNASRDPLHLYAGWALSYESEETDPSIADMLDKGNKFVALIERTLARGHDRGRKAGVEQYPGLDTLVFRLELGAQLAGGKFTVDKKNGKGTIIEALNLLRTTVVQTNVVTGKELAAAIPLAGRHPASTYERAIYDARKTARQRASDTQPCATVRPETELPRN